MKKYLLPPLLSLFTCILVLLSITPPTFAQEAGPNYSSQGPVAPDILPPTTVPPRQPPQQYTPGQPAPVYAPVQQSPAYYGTGGGVAHHHVTYGRFGHTHWITNADGHTHKHRVRNRRHHHHGTQNAIERMQEQLPTVQPATLPEERAELRRLLCQHEERILGPYAPGLPFDPVTISPRS